MCVRAVVIANELRSESVQSRFMELLEQAFTVKKVPHAKLDPAHRHSSILLYILKQRKLQAETSGTPTVT